MPSGTQRMKLPVPQPGSSTSAVPSVPTPASLSVFQMSSMTGLGVKNAVRTVALCSAYSSSDRRSLRAAETSAQPPVGLSEKAFAAPPHPE